MSKSWVCQFESDRFFIENRDTHLLMALALLIFAVREFEHVFYPSHQKGFSTSASRRSAKWLE
ncbi:hypothetical protein [Coleofasciculus sp. LEGE 07092]|uniref:hypothetical protein n=1 Tax=Coleofasciculus sp. LEGE 07092 TaxID=2777969 RepID=UPI0019E618B5|nr:hypothetical protein [Coleofasciculus sp. LEGE 07092]MBE9124980.1 hypothetical protein [Coleofasciculus sp. LEGE 07081]MBE9148004.1 hypothetical protein [Coleofasciculus sp. LEGE 07092]